MHRGCRDATQTGWSHAGVTWEPGAGQAGMTPGSWLRRVINALGRVSGKSQHM